MHDLTQEAELVGVAFSISGCGDERCPRYRVTLTYSATKMSVRIALLTFFICSSSLTIFIQGITCSC